MISPRWQLIALIFYGCAAVAIGAYAVDLKWQSDWDSHMLSDAKAGQKSAEDALKKQQNLLQELDNAYKTSEALTAKINDAERRSADLSVQLRDAIEARKHLLQANNTSAVAARANAATDALVLAELFGRAEQRAANLAGYADRHRAALIACRSEHDAVRRIINESK